MVKLSKITPDGASRTIVRDPRKNKTALSQLVKQEQKEEQLVSQQRENHPPSLFAPSEQNQSSIGSSFASYALAGAGMSLGFILVGAVFGL